ncbi:MAG: hypothetical protein KF805_01890 [Phycisphaeraceae bacterium]|nr:hypothetical protein [Phycisphaeraceae bacterium]
MPLSLPFRAVSSQAFPVDSKRHQRARVTLAFLLRALTGVWVYAWVAGCASPPDPAAFAEATRSLKTSVQAIGVETRQQLNASPETQNLAAPFEVEWASRDRAFDAAALYSQSLVAIFLQAQASQPALLSQSLQRLASSLGIGGAIDATSATGMGAGVVVGMGMEMGVGVLATTADTIAFIHAQIALVQAARSLEEALVRAQPVISRIAEVMVADTEDLQSIIRVAAAMQRADLVAEFDESLAFSRSIDRRRDEIRRVSYGELKPAEIEELARIDALRSSVGADLAPYFARLQSTIQRETTALAALEAVRAAIEAWATAHGALALSVRKNQPPDTAALAEAIARLHVLITRLRGT